MLNTFACEFSSLSSNFSENRDNKRRKPAARNENKVEGVINLSDEILSVFGRSTTLEPDTTTTDTTANVDADDDVVKSADAGITTEMTFDNQFSESPRSAPLVREPNNNKVRLVKH